MIRAAAGDVIPAAVDLGQRDAQGVRHEQQRQQEAADVETGSQPELVAVVQVVEPDCGPQCSALGHAS